VKVEKKKIVPLTLKIEKISGLGDTTIKFSQPIKPFNGILEDFV
jgi:hypothetical protein